MRAEFWLDRWSRGRIGFHRTTVDRQLERHWPALEVAAGARIFVPLCGKSVDLVWLRDAGHDVVGNELAEIATEAFFAENAIPARRRLLPHIDRFDAPSIAILRGDFFHLSAADVGPVAAIYDRAALISWPPESRAAYVDHLSTITPGAASLLLVTLEYGQEEMTGPPFSVETDELEHLFARDYRLVELARRDALADELRIQDRGVSHLSEVCHLLMRRN